jgi:hypothetical protein
MSSTSDNLSRAVVGLLCALSTCGCHTRWSTGGNVTSVGAARQEVPTPMPLGKATQAAKEQDMADVLHEVELLGATDPAAQQQLLRSLQQSKPELWPLVVQQFRATLAYHDQLVGQQRVEAPRVATVEPAPNAQELTWPSEPTSILQANYQSSPDENLLSPPLQSECEDCCELNRYSAPAPDPTPATGPQAVALVEPEPPPAAAAEEARDVPPEPDLLELRHLAFCENVHGYGAYEPYDEAKFSPNDQVSLYVEVENYASQSCDQGFVTNLAASYQILDDRGQCVDGGPFPDVVDLCRSRRRDFHIQYGLVLPEMIAPGKYQLRLAMRDLGGDKVGQRKIAFEIGDREP